jgi:hypothetical protein
MGRRNSTTGAFLSPFSLGVFSLRVFENQGLCLFATHRIGPHLFPIETTLPSLPRALPPQLTCKLIVTQKNNQFGLRKRGAHTQMARDKHWENPHGHASKNSRRGTGRKRKGNFAYKEHFGNGKPNRPWDFPQLNNRMLNKADFTHLIAECMKLN